MAGGHNGGGQGPADWGFLSRSLNETLSRPPPTHAATTLEVVRYPHCSWITPPASEPIGLRLPTNPGDSHTSPTDGARAGAGRPAPTRAASSQAWAGASLPPLTPLANASGYCTVFTNPTR